MNHPIGRFAAPGTSKLPPNSPSPAAHAGPIFKNGLSDPNHLNQWREAVRQASDARRNGFNLMESILNAAAYKHFKECWGGFEPSFQLSDDSIDACRFHPADWSIAIPRNLLDHPAKFAAGVTCSLRQAEHINAALRSKLRDGMTAEGLEEDLALLLLPSVLKRLVMDDSVTLPEFADPAGLRKALDRYGNWTADAWLAKDSYCAPDGLPDSILSDLNWIHRQCLNNDAQT